MCLPGYFRHRDYCFDASTILAAVKNAQAPASFSARRFRYPTRRARQMTSAVPTNRYCLYRTRRPAQTSHCARYKRADNRTHSDQPSIAPIRTCRQQDDETRSAPPIVCRAHRRCVRHFTAQASTIRGKCCSSAPLARYSAAIAWVHGELHRTTVCLATTQRRRISACASIQPTRKPGATI